MPSPKWRFKLDVPHSFATEPGFARALYASDFRTDSAATQGVWRDPVTNLVGLRPSFLTKQWYNNLKPLTSWRYSLAFWTTLKVQEGVEGVLATQASPGAVSTGKVITLLRDLAVMDAGGGIDDDVMIWALESTFELASDEGFAINYRMMVGENTVFDNVLSVQWDNIGLHLGGNGILTVYRYDRADLTAAPVFVEDFQIATPTELTSKDSYLYFMPIAGYGLVVYHSGAGQKFAATTSSAQAGSTRGRLIRWTDEDDNAGHRRLFRPSTIAIGLNRSIKVHYKLTFQTITYNASGTWLGDILDPGYKPSIAPTVVSPSLVPTGRGSVSAALRKPDDSAAWTVGTDRQGRIKAQLTTGDTRYSPWILGLFVRWTPVMEVRGTTPVLLDDPDGTLQRLEVSQDDQGNTDGEVSFLAYSAALIKIVLRGDTTWQLERCDDPTAETPTWVVQAGGLAKMEQPYRYFIDSAGAYYAASFKLLGMEGRFAEVHNFGQTAFDGLSVGEAFNVVLTCSGFEPIALLPTYSTTVKIPGVPAGSDNWRWGANFGDTGDEVNKKLLFYLRTQRSEWRRRYDWAVATTPLWKGQWVLEKKPRDTSALATWTITPFADEVNEASRLIPFGGSSVELFTGRVSPPEGNLIAPFGLTGTNPNEGERVPGTPILNVASLSNPDSVDYLGRAVMIAPFFPEVADPQVININGRRIFDAASHRRHQTIVPLRDWHDGLTPAKQVKLRGLDPDGDRAILYTGWCKRKTLLLELQEDGCTNPQVTLALDDIWEGDIDE